MRVVYSVSGTELAPVTRDDGTVSVSEILGRDVETVGGVLNGTGNRIHDGYYDSN